MANIELIAKIKPKNNGEFALVDAHDIEFEDGKRLDEKIEEVGTGGGGSGIALPDSVRIFEEEGEGIVEVSSVEDEEKWTSISPNSIAINKNGTTGVDIQGDAIYVGFEKEDGSSTVRVVKYPTENGTLATREWVQENGTDVQINGASIVADGVANIPIANETAAGVIKIKNLLGITVAESGINSGFVTVFPADYTLIDSRISSEKPQFIQNQNNCRPITVAVLDYAVKKGITTNTEILTDDEKDAAQAWLGVSGGSGGGTLPDGVTIAEKRITLTEDIDTGEDWGDGPIYDTNETKITPSKIVLDAKRLADAQSHTITLDAENAITLKSVGTADSVCTLKINSYGFESFYGGFYRFPDDVLPSENGYETLATREWMQANPPAVTFPTGVEVSEASINLVNYEDDHDVDNLSITPRGINCKALDFYNFSIGGNAGAPCITLSNDNHTAQLETNDLSIYRDKIVRTTGYYNSDTSVMDEITNTYTFPNASGKLATEEWVQSNASGGKLYRHTVYFSNSEFSFNVEYEFISSKSTEYTQEEFVNYIGEGTAKIAIYNAPQIFPAPVSLQVYSQTMSVCGVVINSTGTTEIINRHSVSYTYSSVISEL